jgi:comEA protein
MLGLTLEEKKVVVFLVAIALVGTAVDFLVKTYSPTKTFTSFNQDIGKVNLNKASKQLLKSIPGVGEKIAQRIIEYRQENPAFSQIEELKKIKGITSARFERIKGSFVVGIE